MMNTPAPAVPIQRIFQITVPPTDSTSADDGQVGPVCAMGCFQRCQYPLLQPGFCSYAGPTSNFSPCEAYFVEHVGGIASQLPGELATGFFIDLGILHDFGWPCSELGAPEAPC